MNQANTGITWMVRREHLAVELVSACQIFLAAQRYKGLTQHSREELQSLLDAGLIPFSRQLRQVLVGLSATIPRFNTAPYWNLIDAIGFWESVEDSRWKYLTDTIRHQYLDWVRDYLILTKAYLK